MSTERRVFRKSYEYFGGLFIQMPDYNKARALCKSFFTIIPFFKFFSSLFLRFIREKKAKKGKKRAAAAMSGDESRFPVDRRRGLHYNIN
jgi:hypothetical protein